MRLPVVLAAGVVIVVVAVLAIRVASGAPETEHDKPRVLVLGDSITDHGQRELNDELGPLYALSIEGQDNFRLDEQIPAAERWATRPFQQVVINLGTNDAVQNDGGYFQAGNIDVRIGQLLFIQNSGGSDGLRGFTGNTVRIEATGSSPAPRSR